MSRNNGPPPAPLPAPASTPQNLRSPPDFSRREFALPELLDAPCTYADWRAASLDLARLNRLTGACKPTLAFLSGAIAHIGVGCEPLHVVDAGCGHGDGLRAIYRWAHKRSLHLHLTGIDLNPYAARLACERDRAEYVPAGAIRWVTGDIFTAQLEKPADLILSSLLVHHLSEDDAARFLRWCECESRIGWCVSDLRRSARAAKIFGWLSFLLRLHPFLVHDGPVSFRRALDAPDWELLLQDAKLSGARILEAGHARLLVEHLHGSPSAHFG